MKLKVRDCSIVLIYILLFISAFTYIRHTYTQVYTWRLLYLSSMLAIIVMCIIYRLNRRILYLDLFMVLLIVLIVYELTVSYCNSLFVMPLIFVDVMPWPMVLFVFYDYSKDYDLPNILKPITVGGMIIVCLLSVPNIILQYTRINGAAVFATYYCIAFLPMLYLTCSQKTSLFFSAIVALLMLLSLKRSAFLIVVIGLFVYYMMLIYRQNNSRKKIYRTFGFMLAVIAAGLIGQYVITVVGLNIISRLSSIIEDGGSGRIRIWTQVYSYFRESTTLKKVFGHGFHAVFYEIKPLGIARYAHNSFLETMYDYGYIGLTLLLMIVIPIIADTIRMIHRKHLLAPVMAFSIVPLLILGFVSYFFEQSVIIMPFCVLWGVCLGHFSRERNRIE